MTFQFVSGGLQPSCLPRDWTAGLLTLSDHPHVCVLILNVCDVVVSLRENEERDLRPQKMLDTKVPALVYKSNSIFKDSSQLLQ